jgi:hypothetical protein
MALFTTTWKLWRNIIWYTNHNYDSTSEIELTILHGAVAVYEATQDENKYAFLRELVNLAKDNPHPMLIVCVCVVVGEGG